MVVLIAHWLRKKIAGKIDKEAEDLSVSSSDSSDSETPAETSDKTTLSNQAETADETPIDIASQEAIVPVKTHGKTSIMSLQASRNKVIKPCYNSYRHVYNYRDNEAFFIPKPPTCPSIHATTIKVKHISDHESEAELKWNVPSHVLDASQLLNGRFNRLAADPGSSRKKMMPIFAPKESEIRQKLGSQSRRMYCRRDPNEGPYTESFTIKLSIKAKPACANYKVGGITMFGKDEFVYEDGYSYQMWHVNFVAEGDGENLNISSYPNYVEPASMNANDSFPLAELAAEEVANQ